jgi:hypothetical protein
MQLNLEIRDKILVLLHEWQNTFGGPQGKFPQYHEACQDLIVSIISCNVFNIVFNLH